MNGGIWGAVGTVAGAALGLFGVWLVQRNDRRRSSVDGAQRLIDQVQEERDVARKELAEVKAELKSEIQELRREVVGLKARERELLDYVSRLRFHIDHGDPPPPPEFPPGLSRLQ